MDLDWLRANPRHLGMFLEHQRIRVTPVRGGDVCVAERLTLDDGGELKYPQELGYGLDVFEMHYLDAIETTLDVARRSR